MIDDQALLHLIARQEHERVVLEARLQKALERIRELEKAEEPTSASPQE